MFKKVVTQSKVRSNATNNLEVTKQKTVYYFLFIPIFKSTVTVDLY